MAAGADASCAIYSRIESAKQNGLDQIPTLGGGFEQLLPSNVDHAAVKSAFLKRPATDIV